MDRNIHDIYDIILKLIAQIWGTIFLEFMEINGEIKEIINTEFITLNGTKYYPDFLCRLTDETLCHIEFQYPEASPKECNRFYNYNTLATVKKGGNTESHIFNFTSKFKKINCEINNSITFHPHNFFLGEVDFEKIFKKINIKVKSNIKLTGKEEIALMLRSLEYNYENKAQTLEKVTKLLKKEHLFNKEKFQYFKGIIKLKIEN